MEVIEETAPDADVQMGLFDQLANFIYHMSTGQASSTAI